MSCMETLIPELVQQNARLNLGFVTINPSGQISMMNMERKANTPRAPLRGFFTKRRSMWSHKKRNLTVAFDVCFLSLRRMVSHAWVPTNDWGA